MNSTKADPQGKVFRPAETAGPDRTSVESPQDYLDAEYQTVCESCGVPIFKHESRDFYAMCPKCQAYSDRDEKQREWMRANPTY